MAGERGAFGKRACVTVGPMTLKVQGGDFVGSAAAEYSVYCNLQYCH